MKNGRGKSEGRKQQEVESEGRRENERPFMFFAIKEIEEGNNKWRGEEKEKKNLFLLD